MNIISLTNGYIVTDGCSFVRTFLFRQFDSRQACFFAAVSTILAKETIWGMRNQQLQRGKIVRKAGIIHCERSIGRQNQRPV